MPSTIYTITPALTILTNHDYTPEDLRELQKHPEAWVEIKTVRGKLYRLRAENVAMIVEMTAEEVDQIQAEWKARAAAQAEKAAQKEGGNGAPLLKIPGRR